jgi:hypothetical protein
MNKNFRRLALKQLCKTAGVLTDTVKDSIRLAEEPPTNFTSIGTSGPGTHILATNKPINADGSVDIIINFRGLSPSKNDVGRLGIPQGVMVTAVAAPKTSEDRKRNLGSALLREQYPPHRIKQIVNSVMAPLRKKYPDKKLTPRLHLMGFSGGGSVVSGALAAAEKKPNILGAEVRSITFNDGLHTHLKHIGHVSRFAQKAKENPDKYNANFLFTAIQTQGYPSASQTAEKILKDIQVEERKYDGDARYGLKPTHVASAGGANFYRLYDKPATYYVDNRAGSAGDQHIKAVKGGYNLIFEDKINNFLKSLA